MLKQLAKLIEKVNGANIKCEVSDYNPHTTLGWINVRGVILPMKNSINLPCGAFWDDDTHIKYQGRRIHLIPLP